MKTSTRVFTLLLAVMLLFVMAAGCSGGSQTPTDAPAPEAPPEAEAPPAAEPIPEDEPEPEPEAGPAQPGPQPLPIVEEEYWYSIWMPIAPFAVQYADDIEKQWTMFREIAERTNIRFEFNSVPAMDEIAAFGVFMASREYTDIICSCETLYPTGGDGAYNEDIIIDIKDLIYEHCPNLVAYFDIYPEALAAMTSDSGHIYSFPQINHTLGSEAAGMVIRKDLLDKYNLESPRTYDDYYDVLKVFQTEEGGCMSILNLGAWNYFSMGMGISSNFSLGFNGYDYPWYVVDGEVRCGFLEPEYLEYLELLQTWYAEGLIDQEFYARETTPTQNAEDVTVLNGYFTIFESSATNIENWITQADNIPGFDLEPLYAPVRNEGDEAVFHFGDGTNGASIRKLICAISTSCEDPVPFAKLVNWLFSEEGYILANYGVEGEGFNYVNGEPVLSDLIMNNPDGLAQVVATHLYTGSVGTLLPYAYDGTRTDNVISDKAYEAIEVFRSQYLYDWLYPQYATLTADESDEFAEITGDMTTYIMENLVRYITGEYSIEQFSTEFLPALKGFGLERALELKQAAYDRYAAKLA